MTGEGNPSNVSTIVAANLALLLRYAADHPELGWPSSKKALADRSVAANEADGGPTVVRKTIQRALSGTGYPTVGSVAAMARAYGLEAWQLMMPKLDPANLRVPFSPPHHDRGPSLGSKPTNPMAKQATSLADNLKAIMAKRAFSQGRLAETSGVAQTTISKACRGGSMRSDNLEKIARALGVTSDALLGGGNSLGGERQVSAGATAKAVGRLIEHFLSCSQADQRRIMQVAQRLAGPD